MSELQSLGTFMGNAFQRIDANLEALTAILQNGVQCHCNCGGSSEGSEIPSWLSFVQAEEGWLPARIGSPYSTTANLVTAIPYSGDDSNAYAILYIRNFENGEAAYSAAKKPSDGAISFDVNINQTTTGIVVILMDKNGITIITGEPEFYNGY